MAVHLKRVGFLARIGRTRYPFSVLQSPPVFLSPFSTLVLPVEHPQKQLENQSNFDERRVLEELSDLLIAPSRDDVAKNQFREKESDTKLGFRAVDGFLSPEEKLRGVFLQKLKGKTAIEVALTRAAVELTVEIVAGVLNRGNLGGESMIIFFSWAIKQPSIIEEISTYNLVIKALGRRKFFKFMESILQEVRMKGISPNCETLSIVFDSYVRAHQVNKAIHMFRNLEDFGLSPDTGSFNVLLHCLCERCHVGAANSLCNTMKGKLPFNSMTYNLIISGWSRFGRVAEMERCLEAMVGDGFTADCCTYSSIIEGLGRNGQIENAVSVFNDMEEKGCIPDVSVYNAIISNFLSVGDFDQGLKYYKLMLTGSCGPNMDTYTKLIVAFLKHRKVADAIEMFDEMLDQGIIPSTGGLTSFIEPLCGYGPPHAALMIYKKARKLGCKISLSAYKMLLMRLSRFGKCGMLLDIWDDMQKSGFAPDTEVYEHVINGLCNIGQLENAALVMEECLRKGFCPSRLICSKLQNKLMALNKAERAYKLFLKIRTARSNENARNYWRSKGWHF